MRPDAIDWTKGQTHADIGQRPTRRIHRVVWRGLVALALVQSLCTIAGLVLIQSVGPVNETLASVRLVWREKTGIGISADLFNGVAICLAALTIVVLILLPLSHFRLKRWTTGLGRLHDATQSLSQGGIPKPTHLTGNQEIDHLLVGFNDMAARMGASRAALIQANTQLEERIQERTRQWQDAARQAEQASEDKSRFLATMSHEIRTPLNGVIGSLQLLERASIDRKQQQIVRTGGLAAKSLLNLINDVLDFSSINADSLQLAEIPFELEQVIEEALTIVGPLAVPKGIDLAFRIASDVPVSHLGDPARLRQILINLVNNAVKFTDQGSVEVLVGIDENDPTLIRFKVRDTGVGMSEEAMGRLFQEFEQAGNDQSGARGGTGLGLSICKHFTQRMGGQIGVESVVGQGSTFWFTANLQTHEIDREQVRPEILDVFLLDRGEAIQRMARDLTEGLDHRFRIIRNIEEVANESVDVLILGHTDDAPPAKATLEKLYASLRETSPNAVILLLYTEQELLNGFDTEALHERVHSLRVPLLASELRGALCNGGTPPGHADLAADSKNEHDFKGLKILVAEDNPTNQLIVRGMLESAGAEIVFADHGRAAVDALGQGCYDLVLMDYRMPVMDGIEATQAIRSLEAAGKLPGHTPIIALTANAVEGENNIFTQAGMDGCLMKPIELPDLHRVIADKLGRERSASSDDVSQPTTAAGDIPCPAEAKASHLFDVEQLKQLSGNSLEQTDVLLNMLFTEFTKYKDEVLDILSDDDAPKAAARLGHKIAGCAFQLSNPNLAYAARALESAEDDSRNAAVHQLASIIDDCVAQLSPLVDTPSDAIHTTRPPAN